MGTCKTSEKSVDGMTTTIVRHEMNGWYAIYKSLPQIALMICLIIFCIFGGCLLNSTTTCDCKDLITGLNTRLTEEATEKKGKVLQIEGLKKQIENLSSKINESDRLGKAVEKLTESLQGCCRRRRCFFIKYLRPAMEQKCCTCDCTILNEVLMYE